MTSSTDRWRVAVAILDLLETRSPEASICPSEVARLLSRHSANAVDTDERWRELMPVVRLEAARLAAAGDVEITQGGMPVDPSTAAGPIRIRRLR